MAKGVGQGDAVIVPDFAFTAMAEAVALVGGTPVFVDVQADQYRRRPAQGWAARREEQGAEAARPDRR
jgi:UDP-2-acetamido-2-deoxy-ribo-hexuluronate aminotransferase